MYSRVLCHARRLKHSAYSISGCAVTGRPTGSPGHQSSSAGGTSGRGPRSCAWDDVGAAVLVCGQHRRTQHRM